MVAWVKKNRTKVNAATRGTRRIKNAMLKQRFGIDIVEYERLAELQGFVCAVCLKPETATLNGKPKSLAVDHNHTTKDVRGLLCGKCNMAIGLLDEDPDLFAAATMYLEKHSPLKRAA